MLHVVPGCDAPLYFVWFLILSARGEENARVQVEPAVASVQLAPTVAGVANNSVIVAPPGSAAKLACPIPAEMFGTKVSWIRNKDISLLSVGGEVYTNDPRLFVSHSASPNSGHPRHSQVWFLHIKNVTREDEGVYQCQTSTYPHVSFFTLLKVQRAYSVIQGPKERVVAAGSDLQLVCLFKNAIVPPAYVFWYQEAKMVNYDAARGINVTSGLPHHSVLKVSNATGDHQGNYTCSPANIVPSSVLVHVIPETGESDDVIKEEKRVDKTPVRQLGVKSASSARCLGPRSPGQMLLFGLFLSLISSKWSLRLPKIHDKWDRF